MRKGVVILLTTGGLLVVVIGVLATTLGFLAPLNTLFRQTPDVSCQDDSDCKFLIVPEQVSCNPCPPCLSAFADPQRYLAVNKNWNPVCPFPNARGVRCLECGAFEFTGNSVAPRCINNQCQKVSR